MKQTELGRYRKGEEREEARGTVSGLSCAWNPPDNG